MIDPGSSWRVLAACSVVGLGALAALFRLLALSRTSLSFLAVLRREHTRRAFGAEDFSSGWVWRLYRASPWLMLAAGLLALLLVATRAFV